MPPLKLARLIFQRSPNAIGLAAFLLMFYFFFVGMAYFRLETSTWEYVHLESAKEYNCDFTKYAMFPYATTPAKRGYKKDANVWLFESHLSLMYDKDLLLNKKCVGAIGAMVKDMSFYHGKLVIQMYDAKLNKVIMRIEKLPHGE